MLAHLFDRFYVVTKFILPMMDDLKLSLIYYDKDCKYLNDLDDNDDKQIKTNIKDLITLNSAFNEVTFNENSAITKENLRTKYTYSSINTSPLTKSCL